MTITCTGPNGEKFEAATSCYTGKGDLVLEANRRERAALQEALETWCKTVKANPKKAEIKK